MKLLKVLQPQTKMKKRLGAIFVMASALFILSGCQQTKDPEVSQAIESLVVEFNDDIPNVLKMKSREEVMALPIKDFEASLKQYMPKYREYFKVPGDYAITDADWEEFRYLLCESMFGPEITEGDLEVEAPELYAQALGYDTENDPDWIYKSPTKKLLEDMTIEEFREYYVGCYVFLEKDHHEDQEEFEKLTEEFKKMVDTLTDEKVNEIRWKMIDDLGL